MSSYLARIWQCRYFWLSLVKNDLRVRYRRSVLGVGWSLVNPIAMTIVLCTVFHRLWNMEISEYGPFVLSGLTFWAFISTCVLQGCQCFHAGESYIRQHPAPLAIYPLRTVLGASIHFLLSLLVVILLVCYFQGPGNLAVLPAVLPAVVLLFVLGWSIAVLSGFAHVMFPDMQHLLEVGLQILFYATPIFYKDEMLRSRGLGWLIDFNPIAIFVQLLRAPVLYGEVPSPMQYGVAALLAAGFASVAVGALARFERKLIFYL